MGDISFSDAFSVIMACVALGVSFGMVKKNQSNQDKKQSDLEKKIKPIDKLQIRVDQLETDNEKRGDKLEELAKNYYALDKELTRVGEAIAKIANDMERQTDCVVKTFGQLQRLEALLNKQD